MQTQRGLRVPAQNRAFSHPDVVAIADEIRRHHESSLVRLARRAIADRVGGLTEAEITAALGIGASATLLASARAIAAAGRRIVATVDDKKRGRLRGAVLERLVHDLVQEREPGLMREVEIAINPAGHSGRPWSRPKELVVDSDPFEAYECKLSPHWINQDDINDLCDIGDAADADGIDSRPTLAVLNTPAALRAQRAALRVWRPIFVADVDDLIDLRHRAATQRMA